MQANPITPTVDFNIDGVQHGFLRLPHSRDDSAWGAVMIPITVVKSGDGPTALLTGGNHGDEYEGPIALFDLANKLTANDLSGRVIIIPAMNYPAFQAGLRVSPIDQGNLNRSFPGRPDGTVTQVIADYFTRVLLPLADYVLDFHSGGKTLDFVPYAAVHKQDDKEYEARCEAAMVAFNAPYRVKMLEIDSSGMYDVQAETQRKIFVTTELGGGGTATARTIRIAKRGVQNFLIHAGILMGELEDRQEDSLALDMENMDSYVFSEHSGMVEFCCSLGQQLSRGDVVARVHIVERTAAAANEYCAKMDGMLIARHVPGLVKIGDCLGVLAKPTE